MSVAAEVTTVGLGLIGGSIAQLQAARLHERAGRLTGIPVSYARAAGRRTSCTTSSPVGAGSGC
jgi:prephenate dehydrogenase